MSLHELTAEQREIRDLTRRFADERIAPARRNGTGRTRSPARSSPSSASSG